MAFNALSALFGISQGLQGYNQGQRENQDLELALQQQQAQSQRQVLLDSLTGRRVDISQGNLDLSQDKFAYNQEQDRLSAGRGSATGEQDLLASMLSTEGDQLYKNALSRGDFGSATRLSPTVGGAQFATRQRVSANKPPKADFTPPQARTAARAEKSLEARPVREELRGARSGLATATHNLKFGDRFSPPFTEEEFLRERADSSYFANQVPILQSLLGKMLGDSAISERARIIQGGQPIQGQVLNASPQAQDMAFEMMTHSQAFDIAKRDITDWETLPFQTQQQVIEKIRIKGGI